MVYGRWRKFGMLVEAQRKAWEWSREELAKALEEDMGECSPRHVRSLELGRRCPSPETLDSLVDILDMDNEEIHGILSAIERPRSCLRKCDHHGAMRPGKGDRFAECQFYDACLSSFDSRYPKAFSAHCPRTCLARQDDPFFIKYGMSAGQHGDRRWDDSDPVESDKEECRRRPITEPPISAVRVIGEEQEQERESA